MMILLSVVLGCGRVCRRSDASIRLSGLALYNESKVRRQHHVQVAESVFPAQSLTIVLKIGLPSTGMSQSFCLSPAKMCEFRPQFHPDSDAGLTAFNAKRYRPDPGAYRHELALLYWGWCHPLAPGNDNLGA